MATAEPLWRPDEARIRTANATHFIGRLLHEEHVALSGFDAVWQWSVDHPERFWREVWNEAGIVGDMGPEPHLVDAHKMPGAARGSWARA